MRQLHLSTQSRQTSFLWVDYELSVLWMFSTLTVQRHTRPFHNSTRTITLARQRFNPQVFRDLHSVLTAVCRLFIDIFPDLQGPRFISGGPLKAAGTSSIRALKVESVCALVLNIGWSDGEVFSGGETEVGDEAGGKMWSDGGALCLLPSSAKVDWVHLNSATCSSNQVPADGPTLGLSCSISWSPQTDRRYWRWHSFSPDPLTRGHCWNVDDWIRKSEMFARFWATQNYL